jgi:L-ascorbate metabolism protein UlaG (beta-lactamase superfamily)
VATELTWLGHSAFRLDTPGGKRIYVDPFLTGNPRCPEAELEPERCDLVVLTHGHGDHVGDTVAIHERLGSPVLAQVELRKWLTDHGVADDGMSYSFNKGGTVTHEDVRVTLTDANHSASAPDGSYGGEACGIVLEVEDGFTIYFAGDTNVFGDMSLIGRIYSPDVAVLPIGDHFTMGPREAAVAVELLGVVRVVPCHYGTFGLLTGTPDELRGLVPPGVEIIAPAPGETVAL